MQPTLSRQEKVWQSKGQDACVRYNPPALAPTGRIEATAIYGCLNLSYFHCWMRHALIFHFAVWRSNSGHTDDL